MIISEYQNKGTVLIIKSLIYRNYGVCAHHDFSVLLEILGK